MIGLILGTITFLLGFLFGESPISHKGWIVLLYLLLVISSIYILKFSFIKKIKVYYRFYLVQVGLFILFSIYFAVIRFCGGCFFSEIVWIIALLYFLCFIFSVGIPFFQYKKGLFLFSPKILRVPISGRNLELTLQNKTPLKEEIELILDFPSNVSLRDKKRRIRKIQFINPYSKILFRFKLESVKSNESKSASANINSNIFGNIKKKIDFIT